MLLLDTVGAKTGKARTAALLYVPDGEGDDARYAVIASKGGDPKHPGWYHNLMANPDAQIRVGTAKIPITASVVEGDERERFWSEADRLNQGGYTEYQAKTDRVIPVVVLTPR